MSVRIVVVDDDPAILDGFKEILSAAGYDVACALDEREAVFALREKPCQVVLTDIVLKETTGIELIPKIQEAAPDALIIMITAYPSTESAVRCFRAGALDYLIKPIKKDDLLSSIKKGLQRTAATKEMNTLRRLKETAEKANREKSLFMMQVSHDIHTIMDSAIAYHNALLNSPIDAKQADALTSIKASSYFLRTLADNICDVAQLEVDALRFKREAFALPDAVAEIARIVYPLIKGKPIEFHYTIDPDVPGQLIGDAARLKQVLLNLLTNAAKFCGEGEISLKARLMTVMGTGCHIFFVVKDTGPGIPKGRQMDVFKPFFQEEKTAGASHQKYGLGLWICKMLVEKMGGLISLHSEPGKGSEFRFSVRLGLPDERRR